MLTIIAAIRVIPMGAFIALGLFIMLYLLLHDADRKSLLSTDQLMNLVLTIYVSALFGARLLFFFEHGITQNLIKDFFNIYIGGFCISGALTLGAISIFGYMYLLKKPTLKAFDLICSYAPLVQAFGRIGCLVAGCCYGLAYHGPCAVTYAKHSAGAPLLTSLFPTQLLSAVMLFMIFLFLQNMRRRIKLGSGRIAALFFTFVFFERFANGFLRGGHAQKVIAFGCTTQQIIALVVSISACIIFIGITVLRRKPSPYKQNQLNE